MYQGAPAVELTQFSQLSDGERGIHCSVSLIAKPCFPSSGLKKKNSSDQKEDGSCKLSVTD